MEPDDERPAPAPQPEPAGRWRALVLLSLAELLGMSLWFSGSAAAPALRAEWGLSDSASVWLTLSVQLGFVAGTLASALGNLPDVFSTRRLFAVSALLGALANAGIAVGARGPGTALALRFATGFFLAGVYPPGMKILASWFRRERGVALGVLIGALTLGKALPYLVGAAGWGWRATMLAASALATLSALLAVLFVADGPFATGPSRFDIGQIGKVFRNRGVRLACLGYFGHMWELYAMWTWVPVFLRSSFAERGASTALAEIASFLVIGGGAVGCVVGGLVADRIGRTAETSWAMAASGACCLTIGLLYGGSPGLLMAVALFWGVTVIADSAQFSACVTELGDPAYMGTALTAQTSGGFLLTMVSIEMIPLLVQAVGWRWAFVALAPGPLLGVVAMLRLRALPEAVRIAQGRR